MVDDTAQGSGPSPEIAAAIDSWGRTVVGAPRGLSSTISSVQPRDEALHRVVTDIVRRDLREERAPATERQPTRPRMAQVDIFSSTLESLRTDTSHVTTCSSCAATGAIGCPNCGGGRTVVCPGCRGAARVRNPQTNRLNNCKVCKATGRISCGGCSGTGRVGCPTCQGSGHQWVWFTYVESRKPRVTVVPQTPVVAAHPKLLEPRSLTAQELGGFAIESAVQADGRLDLNALALGSRAIVQQELDQVDASLERVVWQQYTRLAVPRYEVTYEMCGTRGTLSLSGSPLASAASREAERPIRRRLILWPTLVIVLSLAAVYLTMPAMGQSAYFERSNQIVSVLWLGAAIVSVPWIGGLLRAWRPAIRIKGLRTAEVVPGVVWVLLLLAIPVVGAVSRPAMAELEGALTAGDIERARLVLDAIVEREGESSILELEDAVLLAEAEHTEGGERLAKLDAVVSHAGTQAAKAADLARAERLTKIRDFVNTGLAGSAIDAIDADFATTWQDDPEIAEERARAEELRAQQCTDNPCRLIAFRAARRAHETPERVAAFEQVRKQLLGSLSVEEPASTVTPAGRVHRSDEVKTVAEQVLAARVDDAELTAAATAAKVWAAEQRAAVAIVGADVETLQALFPGIRESSDNRLAVSVEGAELFFKTDKNGICRGLYAVGPRGHRELDGSEWPAERILSQAFGRSMSLVPRTKASDVSSAWTQHKTKIVARWRGGFPVELRIGDAEP